MAAVIDGFPGIGLAGAISSACIVESLKLRFVGELRSRLFPALASVNHGKPVGPVRIYADNERKISVFLGDFTPDNAAAHEVARVMTNWAMKKACGLVVTSSALIADEEGRSDNDQIAAVANGFEANERLRRAGIAPSEQAVVSGLSGLLLLEGGRMGLPVVAFLVRTHENTPDYEAGLNLAELLARVVPEAKCEMTGIREEAERSERALRDLRAKLLPEIYR